MNMDRLMLLNGSPRAGASASLKLAEAFIEGYRGERKIELRRVDLASARILPCTGCYSCWRSGSGACVHKDDMAELLSAYAEADLVLVSTPVYHFGMTAILKAFFERSLPLNYPYMVKKGALYTHPWRKEPNESRRYGVFATCGFPDPDNFRPMRAHFEKLMGERLKFEFFCPEGELLKVPELRASAAPRLTALREAGAAFARTGALPAGAEAAVAAPMAEIESFARMANASWSVPGEEPPTEAAFAGLEPYAPTSSSSPEAPIARGKEDGPAFALLRGMAGIFNPKAAGKLEARLRFDFTDLGEAYDLEIAEGACSLAPASARKATTTIVVPFSIWKRISEGELGGEEALMKGAYRVEGDFGLMMRMSELFSLDSGPDEEKKAPSAKRRPNLMALAFLPWYFGWFLGGSSFFLGQALPFALSLAFLAYREARREATWFERGTPLAFAFLATLALAAPTAFAARWSACCNALIALIWGLSILYGRPLTSEYSKAGYSGAVASGGIFRRVNFGLTALWAILFGLGAAAGLLFSGIGQGRVAIAAALFQVPAGVFTAWFPRWYPAHLARRGRGKA
jgi:putative sterol carrier protein/putative NADPH-quinone reductase